jgi:hypothetical protein
MSLPYVLLTKAPHPSSSYDAALLLEQLSNGHAGKNPLPGTHVTTTKVIVTTRVLLHVAVSMLGRGQHEDGLTQS